QQRVPAQARGAERQAAARGGALWPARGSAPDSVRAGERPGGALRGVRPRPRAAGHDQRAPPPPPPLGPPARTRPQTAVADREQPGQGVSGDAGLGERRLHQRDGAPAQHARPVDVGAPGAGPHRLAHDPRALTRAVALMAAEPTWLRVAELFIPASLRRDPEAHRRARTAVYLCAVPVLT